MHKSIKFYNNSNREKKDVSIVIVNYKSWKHLENCLLPLENIDNSEFSLEIIVVDNFSNDEKLESFSKRFTKTMFIENEGNNGFANGCNLGAEYSNGIHLLFLNPDAIASKEAIYKMLKTSKENPDFGILSCSQVNSQGKPEDSIRIFPKFITLFGISRSIYRKVNKEYKNIIKSQQSIIFPNWVSGSTVFISKEWFNKINGWNEDYWMYYEDVDLSKKVTDIGGKVALLKNAEIIHNHGGASRLNIETSALTKSEVLISRHVYINTHFRGGIKLISQFLLILQTILSKGILSIFSFLLFFIPKLRVQRKLFINLFKYYKSAIKNKTWLSERSINFIKKGYNNAT